MYQQKTFFLRVIIYCVFFLAAYQQLLYSSQLSIVTKSKKTENTVQVCLETGKEIKIEKKWHKYPAKQKKICAHTGVSTRVTFESNWDIPQQKVIKFIKNIAPLSTLIDYRKIQLLNLSFLKKESNEIVQGLLNISLDYNTIVLTDKNDNTLLHYICFKQNNDYFNQTKCLLSKTNLLTIVNKFGNLPLHMLFKNYRKERKSDAQSIFNTIIANYQKFFNFIINHQNEEGDTVLHLASRSFPLSIIRSVLFVTPHGVIKNNNGDTALALFLYRLFHSFDSFKNKEKKISTLIKSFIDRGYDPEKVVLVDGDNHLYPYHWCCQLGQKEFFYALASKFTDVNIQDNKGNTPLHIAIKYGKLHLINDLYAHGASFVQKNNKKQTPFDLLCKRLTNICFELARKGKEKIEDHCFKKEYDDVKKIICDVLFYYENEIDQFLEQSSYHPLYIACFMNDSDFTTEILRYSKDIIIQNYYGDTPLHLLLISSPFDQKKDVLCLFFPYLEEQIVFDNKKIKIMEIKNDEGVSIGGLINQNPEYRKLWEQYQIQEKKKKRVSFIIKEA